MKTNRQKILGPIKVNFPDENENTFSIFEDLAELFGKEFQSDSYKLLKEKLKDTKPKPSIDFESDYIHITTANVDTLIASIEAIIELATIEHKKVFPIINIEELRQEFTLAKKNRPKPKPWDTGDVFFVPLNDGSFTIGQVLSKNHCTCAIYNFRSKTQPTINQAEFKGLKPFAILHLTNGDFLNNGHWGILFNENVTLNPDSGHGGRFGEIGSISYGGCEVLADLANAYWGLTPWNTLYKENYYDNMLLKNVSRPATANILNPEDRKKYRLEKYGVE